MVSHRFFQWFVGILAALVLSATFAQADTAGCGKAATLTSGSRTMTVNGKNRRWILRLPNNYDNKKPYRLIFGVHWRDADYQAVDGGSAPYYGLRALANNTAIFVAPDGLNKGWANSGGEDVTFFDNLIKTLSDDLCINEKLIFSLGFSYGGAMSYSLGCSRPNVFRAVAAFSGAQLSGCSGGTEPLVRPLNAQPVFILTLSDLRCTAYRPSTASMASATASSTPRWASSSATTCCAAMDARARTHPSPRATAGSHTSRPSIPARRDIP
jgi:poly(3-hydroxybutyrate) depolymerase